MANTKISALTSASTALAGTEVLPIVQSSATVKVSVANLTAGRSVTATNFIPSGSSVPTNGLYLPAANAVGLATNTTNAVYIDSSQNVGIGTTSPVTKLHVKATSAADMTNRIEPYSNSYASKLLISSQSSGDGGIQYGASGSNNLDVFAYDNIKFLNGSISGGIGTERARILSTGQTLIDRTTNTASGKLEVYGDSDGTFNPLSVIQGAAGATSRTSISFYRVSAGANVGTITTTNAATAYNTASDYRLKNTVTPMTGALARVVRLKPVTYKWNVDGSDGEGFIAHELAEVFPHAVTGEKDGTRIELYEISPTILATYDENGNELTARVEAVMGEREIPDYQGIDTSFLVATLTAAIQELKAEFDAYKASHP